MQLRARARTRRLTRARARAQVKTLKGVGGHVLYLEEAAYMDEGVVHEVIMPLLLVKDTALICISTPLGSSNYYSVWTNARDDRGRLIFNVISPTNACARCKNTEREARCTHTVVDLPAWRPDDRVARVSALMAAHPTLLAREVHGVIADDENAAFERRQLDRFLAREQHVTHEPHPRIPLVYMAFDPNGGSSASGTTGSESAICSLYYDGANISVRGSAMSCASGGRAAASLRSATATGISSPPPPPPPRVLETSASYSTAASLMSVATLKRSPSCKSSHSVFKCRTPHTANAVRFTSNGGAASAAAPSCVSVCRRGGHTYATTGASCSSACSSSAHCSMRDIASSSLQQQRAKNSSCAAAQSGDSRNSSS